MDDAAQIRKARAFLIALSILTIALVITFKLNPVGAVFMLWFYLGVYGVLSTVSE
ncbi:hypothetical protein JF729_06840 [Mycobacterium intracellulare]|uniref:hypothetical protein n=1 Tax=Mycobacterium intracellulare TaxID=1767 RepID=UPI001CD94D09|nr:hypothetical protein [Mycobacterium intracellulare]MCA2247512.1 hypothetical protein [Mycobacterium intracellulare]